MPRKSPEAAIQRAVVQHLTARGKRGLVFFHVPNGGKRDARSAAIFKAMGVRAGVSDLILLYRQKFFALELKAPNGRPTESQLEFQSAVQEAGGYTAQCDSIDRATACLEAWGVLR